jgi:hypothetical protein
MNINPVRELLCKSLDISFSLNGSFKSAIDEFGGIIDTRALTTKTMLKLVDSLVRPVLTY